MSAFTDAQKAAIRQYLGFSELFHDIDPRLEGQMIELGSRAPDAVARVQANLVALADIDARLGGALDNLDLTKAEDILFLGPDQLEALRNQGRMLIQQVAITFELRPKRDYYATGECMGGEIPLG
jgi:hypothetical protein